MSKKVQIYLIIGIIIGIILVAGGTYAWFTWRSNDTDISVNIGGARVLYKNGDDIIGANIIPTYNKEDGIVKEVTVNVNKIDFKVPTINFYLDIVTLGSGLKDPSFKWALYKNNVLLNSDNFSLVNIGDTLNLTENQTVGTTEDIYKLYIWIDGNMNNPSSMGKQAYSFKLWAYGYHATIE